MFRRNPERIADRLVAKAYGVDSFALHRQHQQYAQDLLARSTGDRLSRDVNYGKMLSEVAIRSLALSRNIDLPISNADRGQLFCAGVSDLAAIERSEPIHEAFELSATRLQETVLRGTTSQVGSLLRRARVAGTVLSPALRLANDPTAHQYITEAYRNIHQREYDASPDISLLEVADVMGEAVELATTPILNHEVQIFDAAIREIHDRLLPTAS